MEESANTLKAQPASNVLRRSALWFATAGAAISLGLTLWTGHRNSSMVLVLMFLVWVASPFAGLIWVHRTATGWKAARQSAVYRLMLLVSVGSAILYASAVFLPHSAKHAGPFLAVPLASWLLIAVVLVVSRSSGANEAAQ
jgi:hypothetical protein